MRAIAYNTSESNTLDFSYLKLWLLLMLSLSFYLFFITTNSFFHSLNNTIDLSNISPWARGSVAPDKGIELYEMFICMPIFLFCAYLLSITKRRYSFIFQKTAIFIFYAIVILSVWGVFLAYNEPIDSIGIGIFVGGVLVAYLLHFTNKIKSSSFYSSILLGFIVFLLGFIINEQASVFDYGFLIGPAKKIIQGEKIGTFYMQYNVLSTLIMAAFLKLKLLLNSMQIVLQILFALWFLMYKKVADKVFRNKIIVNYFILTLIIARGIALLYYGGPISSPQTGPWRLDLWIPILLVLVNFGFESLITAITFSLMYLMDDTFGFLYLVVYFVTLLFISFNNDKDSKMKLRAFIRYFIPLFLAIVTHLLLFKSIMSPAGGLYAGYNFCLIPIALKSSFWLLVIILPICMYILVQDKQNRRFILFLFALVCIQLLYFFGRSHDNNLRHLSGIFLFVVFLSIDRLYSFAKNKQIVIILISLLIGFVCLNYNRAIFGAYLNLKHVYSNGLTKESPVDVQIEKEGEYLKTFHTKKIILLSQYEPYMNYRLGYNQSGYFAPIIANLFCDKNVSFLYSSLKNNYRVIVSKDNLSFTGNVLNFKSSVGVFNEILKKNGTNEQFELDSIHDEMSEMILKPLKQ